MKSIETIIIGGGIAGLGAAKYCWDNQLDFIVLEKNLNIGGLLRPISFNGFHFDRAVHLNFSDNDVFNKSIENVDQSALEAKGYCMFGRHTIRHPISDQLSKLPIVYRLNIFKDIISLTSRRKSKPSTYGEWLEHQYGRYFAEKFPKKYTEKYWRNKAEDLSVDWIKGRLPEYSPANLLKNLIIGQKSSSYYLNSVKYPTSGGFNAYVMEISKHFLKNICLGRVVQEVNLASRTVRLQSGEVYQYNRLVNTIPLPLFARLIVPNEGIIDEVSDFEATSMYLVSIGFKKKYAFPLWTYFYDDEIMAARAHSPSQKAQSNAPNGCSSIQFEVYRSKEEPFVSKRTLIENCLAALNKFSVEPEDVLFARVDWEPYANVIFKPSLEEKRSSVLENLRQHGVYSAGRFGEWQYYWTYQSFASGYRALSSV